MKEVSLLNANYEIVLDLLSNPFIDKNDLLERRHMILELIDCADAEKYLTNCYNLIKTNLPNEFCAYNNYRELDTLIRSYAKMACSLDVLDHGYTMLVLYFLWVTRNE